MEQDLVSIIVPIYNKSEYLDECLTSIKEQIYSNLEIIMIDDGSTDNSGKIADEFANADDRFIVIHKTNGGSSMARNTGLDICKGRYIAFVDADDFVDKNYISALYDALILTESDISVCNYYQGDKVQHSHLKPTILVDDEIISAYIGNLPENHTFLSNVSWNKLYTRKVIGDVRYPVGDGIISRDPMEDGVFTPKVLVNAQRVCQITSPVYHYKIERGGQLSLIGKPPEFILGYHMNVLERYKILIGHMRNQSDLEKISVSFMKDSLNLIMSQWVEISNILNFIRKIVLENDLKLAIALKNKPFEQFLLRLLISEQSQENIRAKLSNVVQVVKS